jgi:hypothetical protein
MDPAWITGIGGLLTGIAALLTSIAALRDARRSKDDVRTLGNKVSTQQEAVASLRAQLVVQQNHVFHLNIHGLPQALPVATETRGGDPQRVDQPIAFGSAPQLNSNERSEPGRASSEPES